MNAIISIIISCVIFFLIITMLPYLIWLFIIFAIVAAIFNIYRGYKIRKMNEQYYQDYHQEEPSSGYTYTNQNKSSVDSDVIDVEFTEHPED